MKGNGLYNTLKQNQVATSGLLFNKQLRAHQKKLCWKCQKESRYEDGAYLRFASGLHQYICKPCMDIKREKQKLKEESNA
jgi:hypothetical protein